MNHINSGNGVKPQGIIGGDEVEENEMPYLVAIGAKGLDHVTPRGYVCSGTLIAHNVVLTAAREFYIEIEKIIWHLLLLCSPILHKRLFH